VRGLLAGALLLTLARCDWTTEPAEQQSLVVETFLETGQSLPPVTLRQTRALNPPDTLADPATGATVSLFLRDSLVAYTEGASGRYEPGTDRIVAPGTPWRLVVRWNGTTARARGATPPPIALTEVCVDVPEDPSRAIQVDSLRRDSLDIPADQGYIYPIEVTVRWEGLPSDADDATPYWIRAQLRPDASPFPSEVVEFFLQPAEVRREDQFDREEGGGQRWEGVYAVPVDSSNAPLPPHDLTTALVRGDTAFASFAQTRTDPGRREPISNVDGALGVALAVAVDSLSRTVEPGLRRCRTPP
jgi:hypothetical protein